jgi:hypothetical protein
LCCNQKHKNENSVAVEANKSNVINDKKEDVTIIDNDDQKVNNKEYSFLASTDNTPNIIREELKDIPGNLYFAEFVDFSQARNKSLELSSKKCKYTIILDDSYKLQGGKELRNLLKKSKTTSEVDAGSDGE